MGILARRASVGQECPTYISGLTEHDRLVNSMPADGAVEIERSHETDLSPSFRV